METDKFDKVKKKNISYNVNNSSFEINVYNIS